MQKRQEKIQKDINDAEQEKQDAIAFKKEYDDRLKAVDKEIDLLLSEGKKKALKREQAIVDEANQEAARIMERTSREVELEKSKVKDEVKTEMILVATEMASHFIKNEMTEQKQAAIVDEVLREMGDSSWQD